MSGFQRRAHDPGADVRPDESCAFHRDRDVRLRPVGYVAISGWAPYASFMNSMAFARFARVTTSGDSAVHSWASSPRKAVSAGLVRIHGRARGRSAWRAGDGVGHGQRGVRRDQVPSVATAATITGVALPETKRHGYSRPVGHRHAGHRGHAGQF